MKAILRQVNAPVHEHDSVGIAVNRMEINLRIASVIGRGLQHCEGPVAGTISVECVALRGVGSIVSQARENAQRTVGCIPCKELLL